MSTKKTTTNAIGYYMKKAQHALRLSMDSELALLDLTTPQYAVLAQLECNGELSNASLAKKSFITAQSMHGIASNLEKQGLIQKTTSKENKRIILVSLTKQGHALVKKAHKVVGNVEKQMLRGLSKNEIDQLEKTLLSCFKNLHE